MRKSGQYPSESDPSSGAHRGRAGAELNDADPLRIVLPQSKQRLLGSDHAVGVSFSVVAEQAHGDPLRRGTNRPVVAGEILGVAKFAGLTRAAHQLLDLAALAGVEGRLAGVEFRIERHDCPVFPIDSISHNVRRLAPVRGLPWYTQAAGNACSPTPESTRSRCRVKRGRAKRLGSGPLVALVFLHQGLAQVEDGRGPQAHEDRRLTLAREIQGQRDEDREQGPAHVDPFATVHTLYLLEGSFGSLYPAANLANREKTASLPQAKAELRRKTHPRTPVDKGKDKGRSCPKPRP